MKSWQRNGKRVEGQDKRDGGGARWEGDKAGQGVSGADVRHRARLRPHLPPLSLSSQCLILQQVLCMVWRLKAGMGQKHDALKEHPKVRSSLSSAGQESPRGKSLCSRESGTRRLAGAGLKARSSASSLDTSVPCSWGFPPGRVYQKIERLHLRAFMSVTHVLVG